MSNHISASSMDIIDCTLKYLQDFRDTLSSSNKTVNKMYVEKRELKDLEELLINGYIYWNCTHHNSNEIPSDIIQLIFIFYNMPNKQMIRLVYADDETGKIDCDTHENGEKYS